MVKAPRTIPSAVRATQARASDPAASAFVSANAGSGKTHVLVQRVIRLLLDGVAPEKILCITFTKAAAANMAERVFSTLGHWVTLDNDGLDTAILEAGIPNPSPTLRKSARKLFACALETLIRKFEDEATAYTSLNLSMWSNRYGAYDDLARIKEWSAAGGLGIEEW